jgi:gas vesicle protein
MMGIFCMASVSIVVGALFGTAIGWVTEIFTAPAAEKEAAKATTK